MKKKPKSPSHAPSKQAHRPKLISMAAPVAENDAELVPLTGDDLRPNDGEDDLHAAALTWRSKFQGFVLGEQAPEQLHRELISGIEDRAWARLHDADGKLFVDFDAFCQAPAPHGLGTPATEVRRLVEELLGRQRAKLAMVASARQGRRSDLDTSDPSGPKSSGQEKRLRAIAERAPDAIKTLFERKLLSEQNAARFGRATGLNDAEKDFLHYAESVAGLGEGLLKKDVDKAVAKMKLVESRASSAPSLPTGVLTLDASARLLADAVASLPSDLASAVVVSEIALDDECGCPVCGGTSMLQGNSGGFRCRACDPLVRTAYEDCVRTDDWRDYGTFAERDVLAPRLTQVAVIGDKPAATLTWWDSAGHDPGRATGAIVLDVGRRSFVLGTATIEEVRDHVRNELLHALSLTLPLTKRHGRYYRADGTVIDSPKAPPAAPAADPFEAKDFEGVIAGLASLKADISLGRLLKIAATTNEATEILGIFTGMIQCAVTWSAAGDCQDRVLADLKAKLGALIDLTQRAR